MPAATVIQESGKNEILRSGAQTDDKTLSNLLAMTAGGNIVTTGLYKVTIDPASLVDAAGETQQVTGCTGVVLGRTAVTGIVNPNDTQDITVTAYVQANGVIELRFQNEGAATVNLASGVYYIMTATVRAGL